MNEPRRHTRSGSATRSVLTLSTALIQLVSSGCERTPVVETTQPGIASVVVTQWRGFD